MIAALFVRPDGPYAGRADVDLWDEARDARLYAGPHPVVAHPPCARWGRYWWGGPGARRRYEKGDDGGCFAAALAAVRQWGGVLEHPAHSHAFEHFGLLAPPRAGWAESSGGAWVCQVEQGHYGHRARKATWLYYVGGQPFELLWGPAPIADPGAGLPPAQARRARRTGVCQRLSRRQRELTPPGFAEVLLALARNGSLS